MCGVQQIRHIKLALDAVADTTSSAAWADNVKPLRELVCSAADMFHYVGVAQHIAEQVRKKTAAQQKKKTGQKIEVNFKHYCMSSCASLFSL